MKDKQKQRTALHSSLDFCLRLARAQAEAARRFDGPLSAHGISFGDFQLLFHLSRAPEGRLRRVDLAERLGLTASGVTRSLLPLEKIGLVDRQPDPRDARVGYAVITRTGKSLLNDAMSTVQSVSDELLKNADPEMVETLSVVLGQIAG